MSTRFRFLSVVALGLLQLASAAGAATYEIDPEHTTVGFQVRHLFTSVSGRFGKFDGKIVFDPAQPEGASVSGSIAVASIDTDVEERDDDLRSTRFFDAARYPTITFTATGLRRVTKDPKSGQVSGALEGKLAMHGVERPVALDVKYLGEGKDPWGNVKAGFSARTKINRKDFGLSWNETLETGGVLVGEEVEISIDAEASVKP